MEYTVAAVPPRIYELNTLDFSLGIRAGEINDNFDLLRYWIEAERLRVGGWGIVEGFELSKDLSDPEHMKILVSEGTFINRKGKEVHVPAYVWESNPIQAHDILDPDLISDSTGKIILSHPVFVDNWYRVVSYSAEKNISEQDKAYLAASLKIYDEDGIDIIAGLVSNLEQYVVSIEENVLQLVPHLADKTFSIGYRYADDRIDIVFVDEQDAHEFINPLSMGIISTSPSVQDLLQYQEDGWLLIGFAYWHVGQEVDVEFFTGDRMLRRVYVDKNNVLYLNGKVYKEKTVIYFEEPKPPTENDLWYDVESEILYIWRPDEDGEYSWVPVNDLARTVTSVYQFLPDENPDDRQTFEFHGHPELYFVPGMHQVTIIIDQVVIMEDQFEELCYDDLAWDKLGETFSATLAQDARNKRNHLRGYGIHLKYPLERGSTVEIRVKHDLNTKKHDMDLFQHDSLFMASGTITVEDASVRTYSIGSLGAYVSGMDQFELYKNGVRLIHNINYKEVKRDGTVSAVIGEECNQFRLTSAPAAGDILYFRILRPVRGYEDINGILEEYVNVFSSCTRQVEAIANDLADREDTLEGLYNEVRTQSNENKDDITTLKDTVLRKTDKLTEDNLHTDIRKKLIAGSINLNFTVSAGTIFLDMVSEDDYIVIAYYKNNSADPIMLFRGKDYSVINTTGGANLQLFSNWTSTSGAKIYVTGLRLGV